MKPVYSIGLDYGTNSVRALLVRLEDGFEAATAVFEYPHGEAGILLDPKDPDVARQHPADYLEGALQTIKSVLDQARRLPDFSPDQIVGMGVDTTGSTPIPVTQDGTALAMTPEFAENLDAMAWLWKDHTSHEEAAEITRKAVEMRPQYLLKCGGVYSSEWFWSKILHCLNVAPEVFDAAYTWVECADWVPAMLCGTQKPGETKIGVCAAGHKAMFNAHWNGYPDKEFLSALHPKLGELRGRLPNQAYTVQDKAGTLSPEWAQKLGLPEGLPVAVGAFDAHLGAVGAGVKPGALVKVLGTSTCDMMVSSNKNDLPDIPGLCGIVDGSILPGYFGLEAGQSAVGDIFNWFVSAIAPQSAPTHEQLTEKMANLKPGESGLLALDWNNGNRTILVDPRLSGLIVGMSLQTKPEEIYRALVEATAFGALTIIARLEEFGVKVEEVINCGGIAEKNPVLMQIYADIIGRPMKISRSAQTCALGAAMAGAVAAGHYQSFEEAQARMCGAKEESFKPIEENRRVYEQLYPLYRELHDAFGTKDWNGNLYRVMKSLLDIRDQQRGL